MTRKFLDAVRSEIDSLMPDNTSGLITPAIQRGVLKDIVDSTVQDEGLIYSTAAQLNVALTGTYTTLVNYQVGEGDDGDFLNLNVPSGTITGTSIAGFSYTLKGGITVVANNNEVIELALSVSGDEPELVTTVVGDGANPASRYWERLVRAAPANAVFTIAARAQDGAATVDITALALIAIIQPTNDAA